MEIAQVNEGRSWTIIPEGRVWKRHNEGTLINMENMDNDHLMSTIAMVERGRDYKGEHIPKWCNSKLDYLKEEAARRGLRPKEDGWDA